MRHSHIVWRFIVSAVICYLAFAFVSWDWTWVNGPSAELAVPRMIYLVLTGWLTHAWRWV